MAALFETLLAAETRITFCLSRLPTEVRLERLTYSGAYFMAVDGLGCQ